MSADREDQSRIVTSVTKSLHRHDCGDSVEAAAAESLWDEQSQKIDIFTSRPKVAPEFMFGVPLDDPVV